MRNDTSGAATPSARSAPARPVAYFSMEIALSDAVPVFAGGLGVLAGDYLRSTADLGLPVIGVSLLYRRGYFRQQLDGAGEQREVPVVWRPSEVLEQLDARVEVVISGRRVTVVPWRYWIVGEPRRPGQPGGRVPVYFLDTDVAGNHADDRRLSDHLYGGDRDHRLRQEALLGIGGIEMLAELGHSDIETFHMNEGHSSLLTLRLVELAAADGAPATLPAELESARQRCVFTTHTPVPAGHDTFPPELASQILGAERVGLLREMGGLDSGELNMTVLGLRMSRFANGVSVRHGEVARAMFPGTPISSITNGVHAATWAAAPMRAVLDRNVPGWRSDNALLRYIGRAPLGEVTDAHSASKQVLVDEVIRRTGTKLDPAVLTIGQARRVTLYKQAMLLFSDLDRLQELARAAGPLQVVCSGKAHPRDDRGRALVADLVRTASREIEEVEVVFLENYDLTLAGLICAGSDVWLNTPIRPNEASGTSGMKAALNGVPSLSILDGWWLEGWIEGVTGWSVGGDDWGDAAAGSGGIADDDSSVGGEGGGPADEGASRKGAGVGAGGSAAEDDGAGDARRDAAALYDKLERVVAPLYYGEPESFAAVRRSAIALNGSFFNTDRMAREYARRAYGWS